MPLPSAPIPGMVVRYAFLWSHEQAGGRGEAAKDRPCVVVLATKRLSDGRFLVRVAPITHLEPGTGQGIEIPAKVKLRLGLDHDASWVILDEMNQFVWPGVDLRPVRRDTPGVWSYGILPTDIFDRIRSELRAVLEMRMASVLLRED